MARPVTLFTGQWADLPLEVLAKKAAEFGYDGLELACWGDHFDVALAAADKAYCQKQRDILKKNRGAVRSGRHPYFSADASYGYVTGDPGDMLAPGHDYWSVSLTLGVPIFDGLLTRGKVREAVAAVAGMERLIEEARRGARIEIYSLLGDLDAATANLDAAGMNVDVAENALSLMTMSYELGKTDYLSVLNMQAERFLAETNLILARNEVLTLTASLKRALGFAPSLPLEEAGKILESEARNPAN